MQKLKDATETSARMMKDNKNLLTTSRISDEALENLDMLHLQEQRRKQLEHELDVNAAQINKQRLLIRQLEKDKDR